MNIVFFTQRVECFESYNERRDCADQRIVNFINECEYTPIPLPNNLPAVREICEVIRPQGIILTGGNTMVKYGGNAPERDEIDKYLIRHSIEERIPIYGFCRGMQSILDFFGNELVVVDNHIATRHIISISSSEYEVNSYHSMGCINIESKLLLVEVRSEDGVIEKISHKTLPIVATMWHPERESPFSQKDIDMVKALFGGIC